MIAMSSLPSKQLQATFVTDGSSDQVLEPILRWLLRELTPAPIEIRWADLRGLPEPPRGLAERLASAVEFYPCELLFVHRDAEKQDPELRYHEIRRATSDDYIHVAVVPVRMQEAWLLLDEAAIRHAAGGPSGTKPLGLPPPKRWDSLNDPKAVLHTALREASGLSGRRAKRFRSRKAVHRIPDYVDDWSALRQLAGFRRLEADTRRALTKLGVVDS